MRLVVLSFVVFVCPSVCMCIYTMTGQERWRPPVKTFTLAEICTLTSAFQFSLVRDGRRHEQRLRTRISYGSARRLSCRFLPDVKMSISPWTGTVD